MTSPTVLSALVGGALIGASASLLLLGVGRVAGISGIVGGVVRPRRDRGGDNDVGWRVLFVVGLLLGGLALRTMLPTAFEGTLPTSPVVVVAAGLAVGVGTTLGNGCTSGHGVCGISRFSKRSIVATCVFIATGMATVLIARMVGS